MKVLKSLRSAKNRHRDCKIVRRKGRLLVKGIMRPEDARICRDLGMDGVVVSNHGGRQLDAALAPVEVIADEGEPAKKTRPSGR